jgi:hypothetical protein
MKAIKIPNGIIHIAESECFCKHCGQHIPINDIDEKWLKQDKNTIKLKCKCKKYNNITQNIVGDFVSY